MKKITAALLVTVLTIALPLQHSSRKAEAATEYISVSAYAEALAKELGLKAEAGGNSSVNQLINIGIIKDGDFKNYSSYLTRGDMLVLLNRADEYLNQSEVNADLVKVILENRISDIKKVAKAKREDIAKGYAKGFLKGYSNGSYSKDRNLKLTSKVTKDGALSGIKMLKDSSLRAKISPDGQLIRTTKLPNNAYMFPYILDSFPNQYYEARLRFEEMERRVNGELVPLVSPKDYTYPIDIYKSKYYKIDDIKKSIENYYDLWEEKVRTVAWNTFNVDYRTIGNDWIETMAQADAQYEYSTEAVYDYLNQYIEEMRKNKTIVECDKIAIDRSAMYYYGGGYFIRCYIHYRIVSTNTSPTLPPLDGRLWGPYNRVLYSRTSFVNISNYKIGEWTDGIFDVQVSTPVDGNKGSLFGVSETIWSPGIFRRLERK